jgi:hypothetical protein
MAPVARGAVPNVSNGLTATAADLIGLLGPEADEVAVLSVLYRTSETGLSLQHASLLIGPEAIGAGGWPEWAEKHGVFSTAEQARVCGLGLPATFQHPLPSWLAAREILSVEDAVQWLEACVDAEFAPPAGSLPEASATLAPAESLLQIFTGRETPASTLVAAVHRPVVGYLFPNAANATSTIPDQWQFGDRTIFAAPRWMLGFAATTNHPLQNGLFVGRLQRQAWLMNISMSVDWRYLEVRVGLDSDHLYAADLEIDVQEFVGGEAVFSRRTRLDELALPDVAGANSLQLTLPSLSRGVKRMIQLYHRDGTLLDRTDPLGIVEQVIVEATYTVPGAGSTTDTITVGEKREIPLVERLDEVTSARQGYRELLEEGLPGRVVQDRQTAERVIRDALEGAKGEILVLDPYFAAGDARFEDHWQLLAGLDVPVRVLTGRKGVPSATPDPSVTGRKWTRGAPPFHDRVYLWEGAGLSVGQSPDGFGGRIFRIDRFGDVEAAEWRRLFAVWWASPGSAPL